jgi:hypothetical protein
MRTFALLEKADAALVVFTERRAAASPVAMESDDKREEKVKGENSTEREERC